MPLPLTDQELESWDRWSKRKIDWKPEDVQRLLATITQLKAQHEITCVKPGTKLYAKVIELRFEVLRKPLGRVFSEADIEAEVNDHHLAIVEGESVKACLVLTERGQGTVQMRQVAVNPNFQRGGLGSVLVRYSELFARRLDMTEMVLHARANVVGFYERLGYEKQGDLFEEVGIPHQNMRKVLL